MIIAHNFGGEGYENVMGCGAFRFPYKIISGFHAKIYGLTPR